MLFKVREFVNTKFRESANHTAKKALRFMSFDCGNAHSNPLFLDMN